MRLRSYACYFGFEADKKAGTRFSVQSHACWGGVQYQYGPKRDCVIIDKFTYASTAKYQRLLISLINEITPCSIITRKSKKYIKFKLLGTYDKSLVLLNFIRNLWHEPLPGYSKDFFEVLRTSKKYKDPLARLMWANKKAVEMNARKIIYSPGHSNVHPPERLKIKRSYMLKRMKSNCYSFVGGY
jgi:hypothetical protein